MNSFLKVLILLFFLSMHSNAQLLKWANLFGTTNTDWPNASIIDPSGSIYVTGSFLGGADFDPGPGTAFLNSGSTRDIFVVKFSSNGNYAWAKQIGGRDFDNGLALALDNSNNIYVTGYFRDTVDFDPGPGSYTLVASYNTINTFILKLDATGNFIWAKSFDGFRNYGTNIKIDIYGNIYTIGLFSGGVDFDPGPGSNYVYFASGDHAYITKFTPQGNFIWEKSLDADPGGFLDPVLDLDNQGNIYLGGAYESSGLDIDPGPAVYNINTQGFDDIFIVRLDTGGNFVWGKNIGGKSYDYLSELKVDGNKNIYYCGCFKDTIDFDPGISTFSLTSKGYDDGYISKLDSSGNFKWSKQIGGKDFELIYSFAISNSGELICTGIFNDTLDCDPGPANNSIYSDKYSTFIIKLDTSGNFIGKEFLYGGSAGDSRVHIGSAGEIYVSGSAGDTVDCDPGPWIYNLIPSGPTDIFVIKLDRNFTGLYEANKALSLKIFPNPSSDIFQVECKDCNSNCDFILYDLFGRELLKQKVTKGITRIEAKGLANGIYNYSLKTEAGIYSGKLVVE